MTWNKKHEEFAQSCNLSASQQIALRYILRRAKLHEPSEIEVDVRDTNKWIGKHRIYGKFHRKTVCSWIPALEEKTQGMITILKRYTPWVYKIMVRPLSFLARIESAKCADSPQVSTPDPMFDGDRKRRASELLLQNISRLDNLLQKIGLKCNQETLLRMWRFSGEKMSNIRDAVKYMLRVNQAKIERSKSFGSNGLGITTPIGWLHECLRYGNYIDESPVELPRFANVESIVSFVDSICERAIDTGQPINQLI